MKDTTRPNQFHGISVMAVSCLLAAILWNGACAKDSISPGSVAASTNATLAAETLVPNEDVVTGGFGGTAGSLWASLDDSTCNDDVDYAYRVRFGLPPTINQATVRLTNPVGTPSSGVLKVRWKVVGNYSTSVPQPTLLTYELFEGTTQRAVHTVFPNGSSYVSDQVGVSGGISGGMTVRLTAQLKPATSGDEIEARVTCVRLETQ